MVKVIDAHGVMAFLEKEPGYEKVEQFLILAAQKEKNILMSSVNFGEVYYIILREYGLDKACDIEKIINALPIEIVNTDILLAKEAGRFKAFYKMSYADCFAAALAKINMAELITGDKEFRAVEKEIKIAWL